MCPKEEARYHLLFYLCFRLSRPLKNVDWTSFENAAAVGWIPNDVSEGDYLACVNHPQQHPLAHVVLASSSGLWRFDHACESSARPVVFWRVEVVGGQGGERLFVQGQTQTWKKRDGWWAKAFVWVCGLFWTSSRHFSPIIIRLTGPSVLLLFSFTYKSDEEPDWRWKYLKALCRPHISRVITARLCELWPSWQIADKLARGWGSSICHFSSLSRSLELLWTLKYILLAEKSF